MADIDFTRRHTMNQTEAKAAIERVAEDLHSELDASYHWEGNQMHFERSGASGHIDVGEDAVRTIVDLGFLLKPMKGEIRRQAEALIDKHLQSAAEG